MVFGETSYKKIQILGYGIPVFVLVAIISLGIYAKKKGRLN